MRKPALCTWENKGADQLCGALISAFAFATTIFCGSTSNRVGNPEDRFSHDVAQMKCYIISVNLEREEDPVHPIPPTKPNLFLSSGFTTRSKTNQAVQLQKMARGLKFRI